MNLMISKFKIALLVLFILISSKISAQPLYINEFMASNVTAVPEIVDYDDYSDWIEIYNDSSSSINLGGYYLSDNLGNSKKWRIPDDVIISAKGFFVFWADGYDDYPSKGGTKYYHTNFSLSKDGEEIGIFSPSGDLLDSVKFDLQISDVSFGRQIDSRSSWVLFSEPTYNKQNNTVGTTSSEFSNIPEISLAQGFYSGQQTVTITANPPSALITYTTDGSRPLRSSNKYTIPFSITENVTLRVRVFEDGKLPSKIVTKSYFIDEIQNLPVLSITTFPETFFDNEIGIYRREIKSKDAPVNVQYFEKGGQFAFEIEAGARLTGQASFEYPQKPLTIEVDEKYGSTSIDYPIFKDRPFKRYYSIYLRNSGTDDNLHTHFRDALQHSLVINQMDLDCQAFQPTATFINGEYWGIYNLREKLDNNYLVAHHDIDPNNIDYLEYEFESEPNIIEGNTNEYYAFQNYLSSHSMNIPENWEYVKSQVDINEITNYLITEIYCDNVNWPYTNSRWWKEKSQDGKWRYVFLDSDYGFGSPGWFSTYTNNSLTYLYDAYPFSDYPFSTFVFRKLFENREFKNSFIQRFAIYQNTIFNKERVLGIFDSIKTMLYDEMVHHINRWNDQSPNIPNLSYWNNECNIMREFGEKRPEYMKQYILDFYNLSGTEKIKFYWADNNRGKIIIEDVEIENNFECEFYRYVPIKIKAVPQIGYKFVKWIGVNDSLSSTISFTPSRSDSTIKITAVFEEDNVSILNSIISENTTLTISGSPYYAKGDVTVNYNITLTVDPGVEILMPENAKLIVKGSVQINGTKDLPVLIKPNDFAGYDKWGYIFINNASGQSSIKFTELLGATQNKIDSNQIGAISSYKSDLVIENVTIVDAPFPIFIQFGNVVIRNCKLHTDEVSDLINVKYAESALVENCDLRGNDQFDTDAIDYDNISNGIIRGNKVYNFYGFNSDGIDLGEGAKNILVENNLIFNCNDKGISVGQGSTTIIKQNIIANCAQGIGIKDDSSYALIDRNTFYACDYGVACFEKNLGEGGGNAEIVNSIFSKSVLAPVFVDDLSTLTVSFSLSDTEELDGINNINEYPFFSNDFLLTQNSPAINAGNPSTELDPDGTIADLGAKYFNGKYHPIVINEINYNPESDESLEFIELYNITNDPIDISGYKIEGAINFNFPVGTIIGGKEYIVIFKNVPTCCFSGIPDFIWGEASLPNDWGNLFLINNLGEEIDFVSYSNSYGWPLKANGEGNTIEFRNPLDENLLAENWQLSQAVNGSPGQSNRIQIEGQLFINEIQADNKNTIRDEFDENDDWIEIYNGSDVNVNLSGIYLTDDLKNLTKCQIPSAGNEANIIEPNGHFLLWADGSVEQGANHLNFKLDKKGESLALVYVFENDTLIIDSISYVDQIEDLSYSRVSDGNTNWHYVNVPTPNEPNSKNNVFENGILLVNGYRFNTEGVKESFLNRAYWGDYKISFWNLNLEAPSSFPPNLPPPIGQRFIPLDTLINYSTVIWTGENLSTEMSFWNSAQTLRYLQMGGNLLLFFKNGRDYFNNDFLERLGVRWIDPQDATISYCQSVFDGLDSLSLIETQFLSSIFDTLLTNENSRLLFVDRKTYGKSVGVGLWNKPKYGGWYKEGGGQTIFLSGRGYRYDSYDLKKNVEFILREIFGENDLVDVDGKNNIITEYYLNQNYPNPFNPSTTIRYQIPTSTLVANGEANINDFTSPASKSEKVHVVLKVYDILGREIETLVNDKQNPGYHEVLFNASKLSSGIYFYRISAGNFTNVKKMILIK